jgi:3-dehydroquinate dehydratase type I
MEKPLVCIPFCGTSKDEILAAASLFRANRDVCDIAEWRADYYRGNDYLEMIEMIKENTAGAELIFTFRSPLEGGAANCINNEQKRINIIAKAVNSGFCDYIDIELSTMKQTTITFPQTTKLIVSTHDFNGTPPKEKIIDIWRESVLLAPFAVEKVFAVKGAFKVREERDVDEIFAALAQWRAESQTRVIAVGMGGLGKVTRTAAKGSWLTYMTLTGDNALGQVKVTTAKSAKKRENDCV